MHWLHILAGALWAGGTVAFAIWPMLLRRPARDSRALYDALEGPRGVMMTSAGLTAVGLGILRGTFLGQVQSLDVLTEPYGLTFLTAVVLAVGFTVGEAAKALRTSSARGSRGEGRACLKACC